MINKSFSEIKRNLKESFADLKSIKVAILGDTSTQFLNATIKGLGYDYNLNLDIWDADYDQIPLQVFDSSSDLYAFEPEFIILYKSSHKLLQKYNLYNAKENCLFSLNEIKELLAQMGLGLGMKVDSIMKQVQEKGEE